MIVCTILLNQTSGFQVKKVMRRFFKTFPSIEMIRRSSVDLIEDEIKELGLQRVKAKRIKSFCDTFDLSIDIIKDSIIGFPGVGEYSQESVDVFIARMLIDPRSINDKEIKKYVSNVLQFEDFKKTIADRLIYEGCSSVTGGAKVRESINFNYCYDSRLFTRICDSRLGYVEKKVENLSDQIARVTDKLITDNTSRQAVIQFDQSDPLPNCTVACQFQIRDCKLFASVFQRSQDVEKLETDCEIFNRLSLKIIGQIERLDDYFVNVCVGNMHYYE